MNDPFEAAGALRDAYRQVDWAATPLGPVTSWSPALRAAVNLVVRSRAAATLLWGPQFVLLYNEAYVPILAEKHPTALGQPAQEVFPEVWEDIEGLLGSVAAGQGTVWIENFRLVIQRHNTLEETYFTFSYSAVAGEDNQIEGVLDIVSETTGQVVAHRRLSMLRRLVSQLADVDNSQTLLDRALPVLREDIGDLTFVDIFLPGTPTATAVSTVGAVARRDIDLTALDDERAVSIWLSTGDPAQDGVLTVHLSPFLPVNTAFQEFLELITATLEQSLARISARQNERRAAALERDMSEALQRSLLTTPVQPDHLQVAVRYQPAAEQAQVGGDWYDAFLLPDGCLTVVVGDVTGHDRHSAAAMAQVRNLARGIGYTLQQPPAKVLSALDAAMSGLAVDVYATAILAQVRQDACDAEQGLRTLRWSNAGHPPPVLLHPDGRVEVLTATPEPLLGTRLKVDRHDHTVILKPGSTVVFYTDGLVERRAKGIDEGIADLVDLLGHRQNYTAEQVCDLLLDHFGYTTEDDIVLAVIHAYPENGPRPAEAGPAILPHDLAPDHSV
ncbi:PP2C family protein-serine/threonine phosphatase [Micromonospora zamorensis]|uniref:PP2C family protein-serine/threonine phosphatase n=1 Tax=Micromonospora zamorensis TaxID=709883 RepID=UPI003D97278A